MLGDAINPKFAGDSVPSFDDLLPILFMIKSQKDPQSRLKKPFF